MFVLQWHKGDAKPPFVNSRISYGATCLRARRADVAVEEVNGGLSSPLTAVWLRTNGVNPNGAAAKVRNFDRLGKKVRPGTFGKINIC